MRRLNRAARPAVARSPLAAPARSAASALGWTPCPSTPEKASRSWTCRSATRPGWRRCAASRSTIEPGEFFGLLGPNGAGKSTLIHCTTGLAQPTGGSIQVFGHDAIHDYGEARQAVGLAPQEVNLDWFLTVEETLDFHAGYFGMPKRDRRERTKELLETFSLTEKRDERTRTLSGGMKRRLILARALMHRPRAADPRRADRRRRHRAAAGALALRAENQPGGDDDPADHALPGGGRPALRPDRLHRRRPDRRRGDERASSPSATASPTSRTPTWPWSGAKSSRARTSRDVVAVSAAQIRFFTPLAARGQPLHEDQETDPRRAAAGNLPLHLGLRRGARLADQGAARDRIHRLRDPRPDHDGLRDQRLHQQLLLDPAAEVPGRDPGPALLARLAAGAAARLLASAASCAA